MSSAPAPRRALRQSSAPARDSLAPTARRRTREGSATPSVASNMSPEPRDDADENEPPRRDTTRERPAVRKAYLNPALASFVPVDEEPVSLRSAPSPRRSPIRKAPIPAVIIDSDDEDNEVLVEEIIEERVEVAPRRRSPKKDKPVEVEGETGDEQTAKQDGEKEGAEPPSGMAVKIFAVVAAVLLTSLGGYAGLRKARPDLVASFEGRVHAVSADIGLPHFNLLGGETLPDFGPITESVSNTFAKAKERAGEAYVAASESVAGAWSAAGRKASDAAIMAGEFASSARNAAYSTGSAATEAAKRRWEAIRAALPSLSLPVPQRAAVFAPDGSMDTTGLATKEDVENLLRMIKGLQEEKASIGVLKGLAVKEDVGQVRAELSQLASQVQQEREEAPIRRTEEGLDLTPELRTKIRNLAADVGVGQGGNAAPGAPSWDTFYDENGRRLRDVIRGEIDSRPAPIDRAELLELVRSELEQLRTELDQLRGQVDRVAAIDQNAGGSLDELDAVMSRFAADRIAISDYALASAGARVLPELTSPTFERPPDKPVSGLLSRILGVGVVDGRPPVEAISKGDNMGECWPMNGTNGFLTIYLARPIIPTQITLQHVDPRLGVGPDRRSLTAPRKVSFWAVQDLPAFRSSFKEGGEMQGAVRMADVEFDPRNKPLRTFDLEPEAIKTLEGEKPEPVRVVSFEIESNWGFPKYTCVYRVRVHGKEAPPRRKTSRGNDS